ncbi:hypothetical protein GQ600_7784 [Phytophthora cactorum]|nr:hypothetical protein GQ600_7784 [Phytophthora cactorum]
MPTPAVCSEGGDDDQTEPSLKRQRQGNKKEIANMQCVAYSVKADFMLMNQVVGDEGMFDFTTPRRPSDGSRSRSAWVWR